MTDDPAARLMGSLAVGAQRAGALLASLLLDGGVSRGPNWTRTAASFGLDADLEPLQTQGPSAPQTRREIVAAVLLHPDDAAEHPGGMFGGLPVVADPAVPPGFAVPAYVKSSVYRAASAPEPTTDVGCSESGSNETG